MPQALISTIFAVLANVLLLAHSVIPHHHHGDAVCFETVHCGACHESHPDEYDGNHDSKIPLDQDGQCCALDEMVMFHPDGVKHKMEAAWQLVEFEFQDQFSPALISRHFSLAGFFCNLPFRQHPPELIYHDTCVSPATGLRAPPIV